MNHDDDDEDKTSIRPLADLMAAKESEGKQNPYLICLAGNAVGRVFKLNTGEMLIGRSPDCEIMLDDDGVSRKHARVICRENGTASILDLGSTNGTYVEGVQIDLHGLKEGDRIQIGSASILKFGSDASEEQAIAKLYESATHDGLTGVHNKRFFLEQIKKEFAWHRRHDVQMSLLLMDIDFFKAVNDTYGHQAGDFVLRRLATVTLEQMRTEDVFARYGGEEFVLILRQTSVKEATVLAERVRSAVEKAEFLWDGADGRVRINITISIGVCELRPMINDSDAFIEAADRYLYMAKENGRNRVESSVFED